MLIAGTGFYQGLALIGTLLQGFVLAVLPASVERIATATALAGGAGLLVVACTAVGATWSEKRRGEEERSHEAELILGDLR